MGKGRSGLRPLLVLVGVLVVLCPPTTCTSGTAVASQLRVEAQGASERKSAAKAPTHEAVREESHETSHDGAHDHAKHDRAAEAAAAPSMLPRFAEVGVELETVEGLERRRMKRAHARAKARAHAGAKVHARTGAKVHAKVHAGAKAKVKSKSHMRMGQQHKAGFMASIVGGGVGVGIMAGGMGGGMGMMSGGMSGGMMGMMASGMMQPQHPVDFPPANVGRAPMGFGQFVPSGKAIPRLPGIMYYTASGLQECSVCKQIILAAARYGKQFYGVCQTEKEMLDMCHAQQKVLQGCPEFTNNWCYQDEGGSQVLRSPCPSHLICHYCLGMNPLHCATQEVIDVTQTGHNLLSQKSSG